MKLIFPPNYLKNTTIKFSSGTKSLKVHCLKSKSTLRWPILGREKDRLFDHVNPLILDRIHDLHEAPDHEHLSRFCEWSFGLCLLTHLCYIVYSWGLSNVGDPIGKLNDHPGYTSEPEQMK